jgi:hypothetical protein
MFEHPTGDEIARRAAWHLLVGHVDDYGKAIARAVDEAGGDVAIPSRSMVRRHAQAMRLAAKGDAGVRNEAFAALEAAAELMTVLDARHDVKRLLVMGRAATGRLDVPPVIHMRVYTRETIGTIAATLVEHGYEEPRFDTTRTRYGRLDRLRLVEQGVEYVLTRCMPEQSIDVDTDLRSGRPVQSIDLDALRTQLGQDAA